MIVPGFINRDSLSEWTLASLLIHPVVDGGWVVGWLRTQFSLPNPLFALSFNFVSLRRRRRLLQSHPGRLLPAPPSPSHSPSPPSVHLLGSIWKEVEDGISDYGRLSLMGALCCCCCCSLSEPRRGYGITVQTNRGRLH